MDERIDPRRAGARAIARKDVLPGVSRPKALLLLAAGLSFFMSVYLFFTGSSDQGIFVGLWVPSILSAGALLLARTDHE
jgi:peptidoglycan/LPS O-acetylase OafA/YrhL